MPTHRVAIRDALVTLFENPVPDDNTVGRTILSHVLGPSPINFAKAIFDFKHNEHLAALCKPGQNPGVWETKLRPNTRTVLDPIETEGQELLLDFLGASCFIIVVCFRIHLTFLVVQRTCALSMASSRLRYQSLLKIKSLCTSTPSGATFSTSCHQPRA